MSYPGVFTISLDFELHWGCFERMLIDEVAEKYFQNTRRIIPKKLELFAQNEIHVTWAAVGMLYRKNTTEWRENMPAILPGFKNPAVSAYEWIAKHGFYSEEDPYHFAPGLIAAIKNTPYQEIGTHTYAHYFCLEEGQTPEQFREDIKMACQLATENGITIKSLVFPRNQFNEKYLSICAEMGITSVRSSPDIWYWAPATGSSFMKKFFRAGDAYLKFQPIKPVCLRDIRTDRGLPLLLPSTRLYRAWKPSYKIQNTLKMRRIINEMTAAAKNKAYYHIWWHPHNFGYYPEQCMIELKQIVDHFRMLKGKYGFTSMNMGEITDLLLNKH